MKSILAILAGMILIAAHFQNPELQKDQTEEVLAVYYFGATNVGFCTSPENIKKIKKIKKDLVARHKDIKLKFVMICLDENIEKGLKFIRKHGFWDEISIGSFFGNELALMYLNTAKIPELPHVLVFKDTLSAGKWNIPVLKDRKLLVDLAGKKQIEEWIKGEYPLVNPNNQREEK